MIDDYHNTPCPVCRLRDVVSQWWERFKRRFWSGKPFKDSVPSTIWSQDSLIPSRLADEYAVKWLRNFDVTKAEPLNGTINIPAIGPIKSVTGEQGQRMGP